MRKLLKSRKALSPVIAAIILIAVTVAVSIAVAAWMGALTFSFMGYEKLEITEVGWTPMDKVTITVNNTGTKDLTVHHIEINYVGIPNANVTADLPTPLKTGEALVDLQIDYSYTNGTAYDISVVTSSGYEFTDHFTGGTNSTAT